MLQGDFFTIIALHTENNRVKATLQLNPAHPIFEGHFPGLPVVPGVCLMQIVKEVVEEVIQQETRLLKADSLKFLTVLDPQEKTSIQLDLIYRIEESGVLNIDAKIFNSATIFYKMKGLLWPQPIHL